MSIFLREDEGIEAINEKKKDLLAEIKNIRWRCDSDYRKTINALSDIVKGMPDITAATIYDALKWEDDFSKIRTNYI